MNLDDKIPCDIPSVKKEGTWYKPCGIQQAGLGYEVMCPLRKACECTPYIILRLEERGQREDYKQAAEI